MSSATRAIVSMLVVAALVIGFWMVLLGPKQKNADELSSRVDSLNVSLAEAQSKANLATAARREFPNDYRQLVVIGQAVPAGDETSSLLVELNDVARKSKMGFESIQLSTGTSGEATAPAPVVPAPETPAPTESSSASPASAAVPPTEAAASLLPLGATIGPAGLGVMPYRLAFSGDFFQIADFIKKIDSLVHTGDAEIAVNGRLMTLDGFALNADPELDFPHLDATFMVTTFVTPPTQGITAGASPAAPAPSTPVTAAETEEPTETSETSETVSAR
jgi:Tfp pilus assembly protein PilO